MPMPVGIATVTLTGRYVHPDGSPFAGKATFSTPALLTLSGADTIAAGSATVTLDAAGQFSVSLVATDNANMQPTDWAYRVTEQLTGVDPRTYSIVLPSANSSVDLADIAPADPALGNYVPVPGPAGAAGASGNTILSGHGTPPSGTGRDGDYWMDLDAWELYGPKASGAWPGTGLPITDVISSVNGQIGTVELGAADVGADPAGAASTAVTSHAAAVDPHGDRAYTDTQVATRAPTSRQITAGTGLTGGGSLTADRSLAVTFGTTGTTACVGNDSRLADARTPTVHAASHASGGSDPIAIAQSQVTGLTAALAGVSSSTAWRRRDLPDQAVADSLYAGSAPTISTAQTTTPTTGYIKYAPTGVALTGSDVTGPFMFLGAGGLQIGASAPDNSYALPTSKYPNTYASGQSVWSVEFGTDAQIFQVRMKYISTATMYRLSIDGRKVTDLMQSSGGTTAGSGHLITFDLGSAAPRRIRLDFTTFPFGGVYLPPTATMWQVPAQGGRLMVFGDSLSDGSAQNTGAGAGTWFARAARLLGATDVWDQARGGTGYITPGSYATLADRLAADVIAWAPDRLVVWAGYNDNGGNQATIKTAADSLYAAIKAGLPSCQVYVIGCWSATATPATSVSNTDATLRTAAATASFPFISPLTGSCYDATGALVATHGPWITSGNIAGYIGGDAVHPTDAGHIYLSRRIVASLRALMPA
ncbi:SGNH/GDSL hydrolase family protein [Streptomyces sp. NBC_00842]|uniref:SGNH/GDSL hydrolase family protein n=1 Tax=Streptomyces sp. NBC_00842 TaxID=2975848 RepID=UPI00386A6736|nr:SGNH/GDSL hydrolase family protein [Streptomyces sp. NBC_00842]